MANRLIGGCRKTDGTSDMAPSGMWRGVDSYPLTFPSVRRGALFAQPHVHQLCTRPSR